MLEARAVKEALVFDRYYDVNEFAKESKIDLEISRLYHRIETGKPDAVEMVKTYKQLKELLLERRKIKNALAVLLYIHSNPGLILTRMGLEKIRGLSDRAWVEEENKND